MGQSENAVCQTLTQNDLTDSEQKWQEGHKCTSPYLVVHLGPTKKYGFTGTHAKFDDSPIHTYGGFAEARIELHAWGHLEIDLSGAPFVLDQIFQTLTLFSLIG